MRDEQDKFFLPLVQSFGFNMARMGLDSSLTGNETDSIVRYLCICSFSAVTGTALAKTANKKPTLTL